MRLVARGLAATLAIAMASCATPAPVPPPQAAAPVAAPMMGPQTFNVTLAPGINATSGRLIVSASPVAEVRLAPTQASPMSVGGNTLGSAIAAQDAPRVTSAEPVRFDADMLAYPAALSKLKPGEYWVQVRLDVNRNAAYALGDPDNDYVSAPVKVQLPAAQPLAVSLRREREVVNELRAQVPAQPAAPAIPAATEALNREADLHTYKIDFVSPTLSEFWGRAIHIRGIVLTPPNYEATGERYPTVYRTEGFGGSLNSLPFAARSHYRMMKNGDTPPMIRVFLDHSSPWGTHEFADSANNGPWGKALTEELIPWLETQYKMDGTPSGRFVTGHSSGGWFAIWQIVRYPEVYGGSWARSPDPVDFRSFTGIDIYRQGANAYVRPDGSEQYLVRDAMGKETTSFKSYALRENVLGDFGGQIDSFDWVFSPRGIDGRPQPLFDRMTGAVDPEVAKYWQANYDIGFILRRDWTSLKQVLDGKIHVIMGTMDTFHLDEAARFLDQDLKKLGAKYDVMWMEGRTHGDIDRIGDDPQGLEKKIAWEMYAVARPKSPLKQKPFVAPAPAQ